jgi:hypothetical protein
MNTSSSGAGAGRSVALVLGCLMAAAGAIPSVAAAGTDPYPAMAAVGRYAMARADEIALAKSAAPASIAGHAEVLVLGAHGYTTAVKGTNGFVCYVARSWDVAFDNPQFWNPKIRSPQCINAASVRSVLPRYLQRTEAVLAGASKGEMQSREKAEWAAGRLEAPEPGAMCFMMSRGGYLNDEAGGPWRPHVMFFVPRTDGARWGADMPGSPMLSDSVNYDKTTIFLVLVPDWSDGTPGPPIHHHQ